MNSAEKYIIYLIYASAVVGGGYLALKYLLPVLAPFIIACILAAIMEPGVKYMVSAGVKRPAAAAVVSVFTLSVILCLVSYATGRGLSALSELVNSLPEISDSVTAFMERAGEKLSDIAPRSDYGEKMLRGLTAELNGLPEKLSQRLLALAARAAQSGAGVLLFALTCAIGTYSFSAAFPKVISFLALQLPERANSRVREVWEDMKGSLGGLLRAELILMVITFFELIALFLLLRTERPVFIAAITAIVDALPVFGTGAVLLPWAVWSLISGSTNRAVWLAVGWAVTVLVRNCLQAKLLGDGVGLHPLVSLLAIYTGWCVCGVWGMLVFPLIFALVAGLNEKGIIRIWKQP